MLALSNTASEYFLIGLTALVVLVAYCLLVLAPTMAAYGRFWEKIVASTLSLFVLAALAAVGTGIGLAVVYYWDSFQGLFGV